jgi:hypothetical protein
MAMHDEPTNETEPAAAEETAGGGGEDLSGVLGTPETSFVSGEGKKPLNTSTLIMAGFLLACGVGTYVMYTRNANANNTPTAEAAAAQTTISQFLSDDAGNVNKMKDLLENTQAAVEQFRASPGKKQIPVDDLQTNPFRFSEADETAAVDTDDITSRKRQAEQRAATIKAAQALNLQFIMSGKRKSCMIDNKVYRESEEVGGFTIESISPSSVIIRKDDARFELQMKK